MTQMSASLASRIWLAVRNIRPEKIATWFDINIVEKAMPKISPMYLARSPSNILSATPFMRALNFLVLPRRISCTYRYMRAAPEDVLTSLSCARRILVSVKWITGAPHFLFECHDATLQMFERTCADSFLQIARHLPDASYPDVSFR